MIFPKAKSWQVIIYTPLEVTEPIKRFIPLVHAVYLPQSEMIKEMNDIYTALIIKETLRFHKLVRRQKQKVEHSISFFKVLNKEKPFRVQLYRDDIQLICGLKEAGNTDNDCSKSNRVYKGEEECLHCLAYM